MIKKRVVLFFDRLKNEQFSVRAHPSDVSQAVYYLLQEATVVSLLQSKSQH
uniref:Uncharacterized protein n=1 Tax=Arundo donax TaxID=35708 RepID=A0A0A9TFN9_ARUDO